MIPQIISSTRPAPVTTGTRCAGAISNRGLAANPGTTSSQSKAGFGSFSRYRPHMAKKFKLDHIPLPQSKPENS